VSAPPVRLIPNQVPDSVSEIRFLGNEIAERRPELEQLYVILAEATAAIAGHEVPSDKVSLGMGGAG